MLGSSEGSSFTYCYSTGLVEGTDAGAFIGVIDSGSLANCYYYDIINEKFKNGTDGKSGFEYMAPIGKKTNIDDGSIGISAIDQTAATYEAFVGDDDGPDYQWQPAVAYDQILNIYYQGKYNLKTVEQLEKLTAPPVATVTTDDFVLDHYGDWPAPEIWTFNEQLTS